MITVLTINYNTPDYLERMISGVRRFYDIPILIVDGSNEKHLRIISLIAKKFKSELHHFHYNIHHGPGLAYGIKYIQTNKILLIDSDVIINNYGFIEDLNNKLPPNAYGIGDIQDINESGFNVTSGIKYLHPAFALCNREIILQYPLPIFHGAPMINAMKIIHNKKLSEKLLIHEPWISNDFRNQVKRYITHDWKGTVERTGGYHYD
jgi:hypothetical protein